MRRKAAEAMERFWATDRGLSIVLGLLVVVVFLLPLLRPTAPLRKVVSDIVFSLLLISGAVSVSERRSTFLLISVVATAALLVRWVSWLSPSDFLEQAGQLHSWLHSACFLWLSWRRSFAKGQSHCIVSWVRSQSTCFSG